VCGMIGRSWPFLEDNHLLAEGLEAMNKYHDGSSDTCHVRELHPPASMRQMLPHSPLDASSNSLKSSSRAW
jgi:hypothetical protein